MLFIYDPIHYLFSDDLRTCVFVQLDTSTLHHLFE